MNKGWLVFLSGRLYRDALRGTRAFSMKKNRW